MEADDELAYRLLVDAKFITSYSLTLVDTDILNQELDEFHDLSYSARFLFYRLESLYYSPDYSFSLFLSYKTIMAIFLQHRKSYEGDLIDNYNILATNAQQLLGIILPNYNSMVNIYSLKDIFGHPVTDAEFVTLYFGHQPSKQELLDRIYQTIDEDYQYADIGDRQPLPELFHGILYANNMEIRTGEDNFISPQYRNTKSNLNYLTDEDWLMLARMYGYTIDDSEIPYDKITQLIVLDQNKSAEELLIKGYNNEHRHVSTTAMLIQRERSKIQDQDIISSTQLGLSYPLAQSPVAKPRLSSPTTSQPSSPRLL